MIAQTSVCFNSWSILNQKCAGECSNFLTFLFIQTSSLKHNSKHKNKTIYKHPGWVWGCVSEHPAVPNCNLPTWSLQHHGQIPHECSSFLVWDLSLGYAVVEVVIIQFSLLFSSCFAYYYCLTPVFRYLRMHRRQVFHCIPRKICVFCSFGRKSSEELKEKKQLKKSYIKQCKSKSRKDFSS